MVVSDVLGPGDAGFWDPAFSGTRVWFDYPRWGDGSTAGVNDRIIDRLMQRR